MLRQWSSGSARATSLPSGEPDERLACATKRDETQGQREIGSGSGTERTAVTECRRGARQEPARSQPADSVQLVQTHATEKGEKKRKKKLRALMRRAVALSGRHAATAEAAKAFTARLSSERKRPGHRDPATRNLVTCQKWKIFRFEVAADPATATEPSYAVQANHICGADAGAFERLSHQALSAMSIPDPTRDRSARPPLCSSVGDRMKSLFTV